jgi:LPXTG-motif cell wall-anchored protein
MKKLIVIGVTALAAAFVTLGFAPSAEAYPETTCNVTVDSQVVHSGDTFEATGSSQQFTTPRASAAAPVSWTITFNDHVRHATGTSFSEKFKAPVVDVETILPLTATALMPDGTTTCTHTVNIKIIPDDISVSPPGHLPNTGGPRLILLIAGLGLVLAGGFAIRQSRKDHTA